MELPGIPSQEVNKADTHALRWKMKSLKQIFEGLFFIFISSQKYLMIGEIH